LTGITQADISRIESGTRNPSLNMIKKIARALNMQVKLEFVPMSETSYVKEKKGSSHN
jgi:transcriptional regulator with XRE-family HTH domain